MFPRVNLPYPTQQRFGQSTRWAVDSLHMIVLLRKPKSPYEIYHGHVAPTKLLQSLTLAFFETYICFQRLSLSWVNSLTSSCFDCIVPKRTNLFLELDYSQPSPQFLQVLGEQTNVFSEDGPDDIPIMRWCTLQTAKGHEPRRFNAGC